MDVVDYQGQTLLNQSIVHKVSDYLASEEKKMAFKIFATLKIFGEDAMSICRQNFPDHQIRYESIEVKELPKESIDNFVKSIDSLLWGYTEIVEGAAIELFQLVSQIRIDKWRRENLSSTEQIKDLLVLKLKMLEKLFKSINEYFVKVNKSASGLNFLDSLFNKYLLDKQILTNIKSTRLYLNDQFESLGARQIKFEKYSLEVEKKLEKMKSYPALARLEMSQQNLFIDLFRLLHVLDLNNNSENLLHKEVVNALKYIVSADNATKLLTSYQKDLFDSLCNCSLEFKYIFMESDSPIFNRSIDMISEKIKCLQTETGTLIDVIEKYRNFQLDNDSNPYISSRWGFREKTVGMEPIVSKNLKQLKNNSELVLNHFEALALAVSSRDVDFKLQSEKHEQKITDILHDMSQPLISQNLLKLKAGHLLDLLYSQSELTSPFLESINYTQQVLNKMLKIDWKYHVFHQFFKFHEIYRVHSGLCGQFDDPAHVLRKKKFNKYFHQVENWVKESTIFKHIHEIELDIHDIKIYLQEFYASIQRKKRICHTESSAVEAIQRYEMQLLEYRYIFGQFFANLIENGEDGRQLRLQFLFVDRYFENAASIIEK